jgi:hypothetical protein
MIHFPPALNHVVERTIAQTGAKLYPFPAIGASRQDIRDQRALWLSDEHLHSFRTSGGRTSTMPPRKDDLQQAGRTDASPMLDGYDPLVVLLLRGAWDLFRLALVCGVLYLLIKYAVRDGIRLARADKHSSPRD